MAIYRAPRPANHFTQIRNDVLRDARLSYRARGILAVVLSQPDNWNTTSEALAREGTEGRDAVRTALSELEAAGYLVQMKRQDDRGRWSTQTVVFDTPEAARNAEQEAQPALFDSPGPGNPASGNRGLENRPSENQALIEHHQEHSGPTDQPPNKNPADICADAAYQAMGKMGNYMALRMVANKALKNGHEVDAVRAAMVGLVEHARPITGQTLWNALVGSQGGTVRSANRDHWQGGGGFTATKEGPST